MSKLVLFFSILFLCSSAVVVAEEKTKVSKDTSSAIVSYEVAAIKQSESSYLDTRKHELLKNKLQVLIDSLEKVNPYPTNYIGFIKNELKELENSLETHEHHCKADEIYKTWNIDIANPYTTDIKRIALDSVLELNLGKFVTPIEGVVTSNYGWRKGRMHKGMDIDLEVWDTLRSCFDGTVRVAKFYGGYGRAVIIRHDNGLETLYAHLHRIKVKTGDRVKAGDFIGHGGSSGHSTGSHLHFEVRFLGIPLNPATFISFAENKITTNDLVLKRIKSGFACFPKGAEFHVVARGEYLHKISLQYGVSIEKLCELNGMRRNKLLSVGEKLRVI